MHMKATFLAMEQYRESCHAHMPGTMPKFWICFISMYLVMLPSLPSSCKHSTMVFRVMPDALNLQLQVPATGSFQILQFQCYLIV